VLRRTAYMGGVLGDVLRLEPGRAPGGGDSAVEHAWALAAARGDVALAFAEKAALGAVDLDSYDAVVVAFGFEAEDVLPEEEAAALEAYVRAGGRLVVSGAHFARWVSERGGAASRRLLSLLGVAYRGEAAGGARLVPEGAFARLGPFALGSPTDWGLSGAESFDVVRELGGAARAIALGSDAAAVAVPGRSVVFSFPLESAPIASFRAALLSGALSAALGPEDLAIDVRSPLEPLELEGGAAELVLGVEGPSDARYLWSLEAGPASGVRLPPEPWDLARPGFGFGDDDDATPIPEAERGCRSVLLRRSFAIADPSALESLVLDVRSDDGFVAYLNGAEIARRNVAPGSERVGWAESAVEPVREEIECWESAAPLLRAGENVLAVSFQNVSATSSDLTADASLRAIVASAGAAFLIPPGAAWHVRTCGETAAPEWSSPRFDPSGRAAAIRFFEPGDYVLSVRAEGLEGRSEPRSLAVRVVPAGGLVPFLRGDASSDGAVDIGDAIATLGYLFGTGSAPCLSAMDANASGRVDISDAIYVLGFLFLGSEEPPAPGPFACGLPAEPDDLGCERPADRCR
ncbi:MAG: hypothetical protein ACUVYA_10515, partial [Planctomycetota bacterium]